MYYIDSKLMHLGAQSIHTHTYTYLRVLLFLHLKNAVIDYVGVTAQLGLTLCHPRDCSLPGSSVHGISQAKILKRVGLAFSPPGDLPHPGIEPTSPVSPSLQVDSLPLSHLGSPIVDYIHSPSIKNHSTFLPKACLYTKGEQQQYINVIFDLNKTN